MTAPCGLLFVLARLGQVLGSAAPYFMRDDINKLPLPDAAKRYARRKGLATMKRQPKEFSAVNAMLTNPGKPNKVKNYVCGRTSTGGSLATQKHAIKDSAQRIVDKLLND